MSLFDHLDAIPEAVYVLGAMLALACVFGRRLAT
jgi:hypothetical protein